MQLNGRLVTPDIPNVESSSTMLIKPLVTTHLTTLHHGSVLLLESFVQAGGALEVLVDTAHDAGLLTVNEGLGGEVVDAVIEAALDHLGVHLEEERLGFVGKGGNHKVVDWVSREHLR
jgi:hypothetical protein